MEEDQPKSDQEIRLEQANKLFQTSVMLIYGKRKSVEKAIKCVQRAIVLDDSNYKYWQLLGEAYYQRGSLNPSINCFMKSLSLADKYLNEIGTNLDDVERTRVKADSTYSRLRMSDIRLSVHHQDEALAGYSDIIQQDPKNVAALVGMSKVELLEARRCYHSGLVKSGLAHCMDALKYALRSVKLSPHLSFTWKLASDCCLIQVIYGQRGEFTVHLGVADFPGGNDKDGLVITRVGCIELAQQFLCKALTISPYESSSSLWHNLGISLYFKFVLMKQQEPTECRLLLKRSLKCLIKALDYDRTNSQVRNSMAIVAYHLDLLNTSQEFLIKSIQTNMSTSEIQFSNLGYIFLQKGEFRLASIAFKRCQAEEPLYCRSWLGNALVHEQNSLDNMSLLRHCYKLENNYESQMMYATKVTSLPYDEDHARDLINAMDCMNRIINYDENSVAAANTIGLLYERCNFKSQAKRYFDHAYTLAPDDSRVIFNRLRQLSTYESTSCMIDSGLAETLDDKLLSSADRLADSGNLGYMLNFIYFLFRNSDYQSINSRITKVIEKLPQDDLRSKIAAQILLAMTGKASNKDFKSWLYKNIIDSEGLVCLEPLINLFCLMLFGAITNDTQLLDQVGVHLSKYLIAYLSAKKIQFADTFYSIEGTWLRLTLAASIFCYPEGKLLRPIIALFPYIAELWLFLGLSLMFQKSKEKTAIFCIEKANIIGSTNANLSVVCNILLAITSSRPTSGKQTKKGFQPVDMKARTSYLSRALYSYPGYKLLWECLHAAKFHSDQKESSAQNNILAQQDVDLFQLAIDHTLTMITT